MEKRIILLVNLLLFIIGFHIIDFYAFSICWQYDFMYDINSSPKWITYLKNYTKIHNCMPLFDKKYFKNYVLSNSYGTDVVWNPYRAYRAIEPYYPVYNDTANKSIVVFGCSFAFEPSADSNFTYYLSKSLPNYRIYNRAHGGWSTSHMLYQLQYNNFSYIPNPKYIIYEFISDHLIRNSNFYIQKTSEPFYKEKEGVLYLKKFSLNYIKFPLLLYIRNEIHRKMINHIENNEANDIINYTRSLLLQSKIYTKYKFNDDTKFIILRYDNGEEEPYNWMFEELKREGFIIVSLKDLSKTDYFTIDYQISKTDKHPNPRAWQEITPLFVKYLQDRGYLKE